MALFMILAINIELIRGRHRVKVQRVAFGTRAVLDAWLAARAIVVRDCRCGRLFQLKHDGFGVAGDGNEP